MTTLHEPRLLSLETIRVLGSVVVRIRGELDLYTAPALRTLLDDLMEQDDDAPIVLELAEMTFVDSTGLGEFVRALKRSRAKGRAVRLSSPTKTMRKFFEIAGIDRVFEIDT